jgi:spermidine synthase
MNFFKRKNLYLFGSFVAGFSIMTVELISSRIVAPIIGSSVYTWTSVIGITLLGLSIGSWGGGKMADKIKNNNFLSYAFFVSAILVSIIPILSQNTKIIVNSSNSILLLNVSMSFYLFFIPAIAIGMIQPIILKKYADNFSKIASEYGLLSSIWSVGSVLGVFATGFFFISTIGSMETIWIVALLLFTVGLSFVEYKKKDNIYIFITFLILISSLFIQNKTSAETKYLFEKETNYFKAKVADVDIYGFGKSRVLFLDSDSHSIMPEKINQYFYPEIYPVFSNLKKDIKNILVIGAGAYTLPKYFKDYYKEAEVSVVEVDPALEKIAEDYFDLKKYNIKTKIGDAKVIINKETQKYDVIFGDAYNSFISVPWYLLTKEWNDEVKEKLTDNGIYAVNFIGELEGEKAGFTESVLETFKLTFPNFYVFNFGLTKQSVQNIVIIGVKGDLPLTKDTLAKKLFSGKNSFLADKLLVKDIKINSKSIILRDNFAPVEKLMSPVIRYYFSRNSNSLLSE